MKFFENIKIWALCLSLLVSGCAQTVKYNYPYDGSNLVSFNTDNKKTIKVDNLKDSRSFKNDNSYLMGWIPLMPYGWGEYNKPDKGFKALSVELWYINVANDLKISTEKSLTQSNLFTIANDKSVDYIVKTDLIDFKYNGALYHYGLSIYGPILWPLGLPTGSSRDTIKVELSLVDAKNNKEIFSKTYFGSEKITQGLYYNNGKDFDNFPKIYQDIMNEFITDIKDVI